MVSLGKQNFGGNSIRFCFPAPRLLGGPCVRLMFHSEWDTWCVGSWYAIPLYSRYPEFSLFKFLFLFFFPFLKEVFIFIFIFLSSIFYSLFSIFLISIYFFPSLSILVPLPFIFTCYFLFLYCSGRVGFTIRNSESLLWTQFIFQVYFNQSGWEQCQEGNKRQREKESTSSVVFGTFWSFLIIP